MPYTEQPAVTLSQLLQWKYAIGLESKGLKHSRGSVTAHAKKVLGVKGNREKVLASVLAEIEKLMHPLVNEKRDIKCEVEMTDTFGGEANYSWVIRHEFMMPHDASDAQIVRRAKALVGMTGVQC